MKNIIAASKYILAALTFLYAINANAIDIKELRAVQGNAIINPLSMSTRVTWPENIKTVEDAARYVLEPTGYDLVIDSPAPVESLRLSRKPVPPIAKLNRTMPIVDVLQLLVGLDNSVIIDINHKLVSFKEGYK